MRHMKFIKMANGEGGWGWSGHTHSSTSCGDRCHKYCESHRDGGG